MSKRNFVAILLRLVLIVAVLGLVVSSANAQNNKPKGCGPTTVVDAAGRVHKRYKTNCISSAERKSVARRQIKALRSKPAQQPKTRRVKR